MKYDRVIIYYSIVAFHLVITIKGRNHTQAKLFVEVKVNKICRQFTYDSQSIAMNFILT